MDISVVIPVYGCPEAIPELYRRLVDTLAPMGCIYEIIMVDDHDEKGSWEEVKKIAIADEHIKAIHFTQNYGQDKALTAGINQATGDWIITMDCDLQDAPENIPVLYEKAVSDGLDVVFVRRQNRKDSCITQFLSRVFHRVVSFLSGIPHEFELGTYLIASNRAAELYCSSKDRGRDFTMFLLWLGFKHGFIELEHDARFAGESSYSLKKKFDYAVRMMTTFSNRILYIPIIIGMFAMVGSIVYLIVTLIMFFAYHNNPEGWTTLVVAVFFFGGTILSTLGVIGIYIGNVFDMTKNRPLYVVQETMNCENSDL